MNKSKKIIGLHGAGMHAGAFGGLAPHLGFPFAALTLPGHFGHEDAPLLQSIADMAQYVRTRLDREEAASVVLCGHSMGALVALAASDHPALAGIVAMGAAQTMPVHADLLAMAKDTPQQAHGLIAKWGVYAEHGQVETVRGLLQNILSQSVAGALYNDLSACNAALPAKMLRDMPLLVIVGTQDQMVKPADSMALADAAGGSYVLLENCGHMMMMEKPIETAREIRDFAQDVWR